VQYVLVGFMYVHPCIGEEPSAGKVIFVAVTGDHCVDVDRSTAFFDNGDRRVDNDRFTRTPDDD
jgi:hypothetical protein